MIRIQKFIFNPFLENTYIVWDEYSKEAAVIDPGCYDAQENEAIKNFIEENQLIIKYIINTHCHLDHIFGNAFIKENFDVPLLMPRDDLFLLDLMVEQAKSYGVKFIPSPRPDELIQEGSKISLGETEGKFIFTPGHTPGEVCLYFEKEKICFTGDVLFNESIGRADLWKGDFQTLINSIKEKLLSLPDDVTIYPGHESRSSIGYEKKNNPFLLNIK